MISLQIMEFRSNERCFYVVVCCFSIRITSSAFEKKFHHILSFIKCTSVENNSLVVIICACVSIFIYVIFVHFWTEFTPFACHKCWRAEMGLNDTITTALASTLVLSSAPLLHDTKAHRKHNHFILLYNVAFLVDLILIAHEWILRFASPQLLYRTIVLRLCGCVQQLEVHPWNISSDSTTNQSMLDINTHLCQLLCYKKCKITNKFWNHGYNLVASNMTQNKLYIEIECA